MLYLIGILATALVGVGIYLFIARDTTRQPGSIAAHTTQATNGGNTEPGNVPRPPAIDSNIATSSNWSLPMPTGFVNDFVGVIDQAMKDKLEKRLTDFRDHTHPPVGIAIAVVRTTGDRSIFDYSLAMARAWNTGSNDDYSPKMLLLVAIDDRKYFTQVSKGLEDELPDDIVGSLQQQYLVPEFKRGHYGKGIEDTVNSYITTIENKRGAHVETRGPPY
jgi:uncharacterized protein